MYRGFPWDFVSICYKKSDVEEWDEIWGQAKEKRESDTLIIIWKTELV